MRADEEKIYCLTIDDTFRFFEESTKEDLASIFDHPYMSFFKSMHETYHCKIQFNTFLSYDPGGFSLREVSGKWRGELSENAHWLRFSFHSRANTPPFPYLNAPAENLCCDFREVMQELDRIAGSSASSLTTTLHYVCADKDACKALRQLGVRGLIGMFYDHSGPESLRYYLSDSQNRQMNLFPLGYDPETDLVFLRNMMILNKETSASVFSKLEETKEPLFHLMIHEQYFYQDYVDYQKDFCEKVECSLCRLEKKNYRSVFFEELLHSQAVRLF